MRTIIERLIDVIAQDKASIDYMRTRNPRFMNQIDWLEWVTWNARIIMACECIKPKDIHEWHNELEENIESFVIDHHDQLTMIYHESYSNAHDRLKSDFSSVLHS